LYPANNVWAAGAVEKFLNSFADFFEVNRRECASGRPFPADEHEERLCMMNEAKEPYRNPADPMTTAYASIFVPSFNFTEVSTLGLHYFAAIFLITHLHFRR
jgi:hypothetical protein